MGRSNISLSEYCYLYGCEEILEHLVDKVDEGLPYASHTKVKWKCDKGHVFLNEIYKYTTPNRRTFRCFKCPICTGGRILLGYNDLPTTHPEIAAEWGDNDRDVKTVSQGSRYMANWVCKNGHTWTARVSARTYGNEGCPYCAKMMRTSKGEQLLYLYLSKAFSGVTVYNKEKLAGVEFDVLIPDCKLAFEFDGMYCHSINDTSYKFGVARDNGYKLIKVCESDSTSSDFVSGVYNFRVGANLDISDFAYIVECLLKDLSRYYNLASVDINVKRDLSLVTGKLLTQSDVLKKWQSALEPFWDEKRNGYPLRLAFNDCLPKYWVCKFGHHFERRLDVIDRNNGLRCPCCKKNYTWRFISLFCYNFIFIFDRELFDVECIDSDKAFSYITEDYINIRGLHIENNFLILEYGYISDISQTAFNTMFNLESIMSFRALDSVSNLLLNFLISLFTSYPARECKITVDNLLHNSYPYEKIFGGR